MEGGDCGTGLACICHANSAFAEGGDSTNDGYSYLTMTETTASAAPGYVDNTETTCAQCVVQGSSGAVYTRWGNQTCPQGHTTVYKGYMASSESGQSAGGAQYVCLTEVRSMCIALHAFLIARV